VLWGAQNVMINTIEPDSRHIYSLAEIRAIDFPEEVIKIAIILHIISVLGAIVMCRRHRLKPAQVATWISLCTFLSLPALVACLLLNPLRPDGKTPVAKPADKAVNPA
jgi:hypothetical protein